jgi:hypothetical protein
LKFKRDTHQNYDRICPKKAATLKNLTLFLKFLKINSNHRVTEYENLNPTKLEALNSKLQQFSINCFVNSSAQKTAIRENISSFASKWVKLDTLF